MATRFKSWTVQLEGEPVAVQELPRHFGILDTLTSIVDRVGTAGLTRIVKVELVTNHGIAEQLDRQKFMTMVTMHLVPSQQMVKTSETARAFRASRGFSSQPAYRKPSKIQ